ncbi:MAG TPA: ABC transporter permease [Thermoanaerobaculia bacterium]|nr:ABC transporter permease [Thermoanaerobaculia bacterium]
MSMVLAVAKNRLMNLKRDRAAFVLAFVLPVAFFTIFASIFAGSGRATTRKVSVAIVDEDGSETSRRFVAGLKAEPGLSVGLKPGPENDPIGPFYTAAQAEQAVRKGEVPVALIIPKGFGENAIGFGPGANRARLQILADSSDPVAPPMLNGLLQKVAMTSMPAAMARSGLAELEKWSGGLTPEQKARMDQAIGAIEKPSDDAEPSAGKAAGGGGLVAVETRDILGETKKNPTVTFYAAGLGVMFLLFSAAGAGGALIEEAESGTLDRILATRVSMTRLLLGKLLYLSCVGVAQLTLMFVWGAILFGLELWSHIPGFVIMALATALASSAFGLMLASVCHSRMQLVALSNLSILLMSALGGSLFPRFLMSEKLQKIGLITLNAWALDGFQKIFWRDEPLWAIWPQVAVLALLGAVFFLIARRVAQKWESA